LFVINKNVCIV